jgi:hypothetical protein
MATLLDNRMVPLGDNAAAQLPVVCSKQRVHGLHQEYDIVLKIAGIEDRCVDFRHGQAAQQARHGLFGDHGQACRKQRKTQGSHSRQGDIGVTFGRTPHPA